MALAAPASPAIAQGGIIADESGAIRFVAWAKSNAPAMAEGSWNRIESAVVDEFKGIPNLKIHGTTVKEITEDRRSSPHRLRSRTCTPVSRVSVRRWSRNGTPATSGCSSRAAGRRDRTIKFVIWKGAGKGKSRCRRVHSIFMRRSMSSTAGPLNLNTATIMQEDAEITVSGGETVVRGSIVHIAPVSGIIKRCPVEGCNRALSRQNYCPIHEIQPKFVYDLRLKGWLDDGEKTHSILIQRDVVEFLTGITLAAAQEIAENNPLGMDEVFLQMRDKVLGRYVVCHGREIDGRVLVNTCERVKLSRANMLPC